LTTSHTGDAYRRLKERLTESPRDQYAFRPTGSTSAALIAITHHVLETVKTEPYVRLISLDFSKAFDTVRHNSLAEQLASMPVPDFVYNWVLAMLLNRVHCTKFCGIISCYKRINASIIQGSGLGPGNFLTTISGLKLLHPGNRLFKYADDCYLIIPASNIATTDSELDHIALWAKNSNLRLNPGKSCEIIIRRPLTKIHETIPPIVGIERVNEIKILGVTLSERIGFSSHVNKICIKAKQSFFALRVLVAHGLTGNRLHDVVRSTTLAQLLYASPSWWGFTTVGERERMTALVVIIWIFWLIHPNPWSKCGDSTKSLLQITTFNQILSPCHQYPSCAGLILAQNNTTT